MAISPCYSSPISVRLVDPFNLWQCDCWKKVSFSFAYFFFFLSASEAEVCVWHICISSSVLPFHILCYFSTGLFLLIVITRTFLCILGSNNLTGIYIANTVTTVYYLCFDFDFSVCHCTEMFMISKNNHCHSVPLWALQQCHHECLWTRLYAFGPLFP